MVNLVVLRKLKLTQTPVLLIVPEPNPLQTSNAVITSMIVAQVKSRCQHRRVFVISDKTIIVWLIALDTDRPRQLMTDGACLLVVEPAFVVLNLVIVQGIAGKAVVELMAVIRCIILLCILFGHEMQCLGKRLITRY